MSSAHNQATGGKPGATKLRSAAAQLYDLTAVVVAWVGAFGFRFNFQVPGAYREAMLSMLLVVLPLAFVSFRILGLYQGIWRFASIPDLRRIALADGLAGLCTGAVLALVSHGGEVPRSVILLYPILLVVLMGGGRFIYRAWKDGHVIALDKLDASPVIVLGAGSTAAALLKNLSQNSRWNVVALLDDDEAKRGLRLYGVPIVGPIESLPLQVERYRVGHVILAIPSASAQDRRRITEQAIRAEVDLLTVPSAGDILSGNVSVSKIRPVELEDLLGREPVQLDNQGLHRLINGNTVMVTGAGGSIGSELCRQIAAYGPSRLVMMEQSELALYSMEQEFSRSRPNLDVAYVVGDVRNAISVGRAFLDHVPQVVFHAAAYKHVPLMEGPNAWQAVQNNVRGTRTVAEAAIKYGTHKFVLISTDKAVNPTNVMGATKRLAELTCLALQNTGSATRFITVRFGNVLGSSGSVIPKFKEQIEQGGPITVTHKDIVRYFMLIPEAAQLVLQAGLMGSGGEIYVLEMGEPVKIFDLARDMIRLSGFAADEIPIAITGLRPGEKLYEELLADCETTLATPHPKLRVAKADHAPDSGWLVKQEEWLALPVREYEEAKADLKTWVPEYSPAAP